MFPIVGKSFNKSLYIFQWHSWGDGTGTAEHQADLRPFLDQPVDLFFDVRRFAMRQGGGNRNASNDKKFVAVPFLHPADFLIVHAILVLESLEAANAALLKTRNHVHEITVTVPDKTDVRIKQGLD